MNMKNFYTLTYWLLVMVFAAFLSGALGVVPITTECSNSYTQGVNAVVKCYINTTAVTSAGCSDADTLYVQYSKTGDVPTILCRTSYPTCVKEGVNCGCSSSSGSVQYQVSFTPNVNTHNGVNLECTLNCLRQVPKTTNGTCQSISVVSVTTVTSPATTTVKSGSTASTIHGLTTGTIITVGIIGLVAFF